MTFEVDDLEPCLTTTLELLQSAEREAPPFQACFGFSLGPLEVSQLPSGRFTFGAAIDRAQLLANRARAGEVVLDAEAQAAASSLFLFDRHVATGPGAPRGRIVDRKHPRRGTNSSAFAAMGSPGMPRAVAESLERLVELTGTATGVDRLLLRGPLGAGHDEWIDHLRGRSSPRFVLELPPVPAALEPLGSLRLGLEVLHATYPQAIEPLLEEHRRTLASVSLGEPVFRSDALLALQALLGQGEGPRPWIVADVIATIDPSSLALLAETIVDDGPEVLFLARLPVDTRPPSALMRTGLLEELVLPGLTPADGREVAAAVLGPETPPEVARRIAVLGGTTPLGILEAARALLTSGDLVLDPEGGYRWRLSPRGGVAAVPVESLINERLTHLAPAHRKVLEVICAAPIATATPVLRAAVKLDGENTETFDAAIGSLALEGFVTPTEPWRASSLVLRNVVVQSLPPARSTEIHKRVADAMGQITLQDATFARATYGYFLGEGGREQAGARALLEAGRDAATRDFGRAALRLAAAAVQFDSSDGVRADATALSRAVSRKRPSNPDEIGGTAQAGRLHVPLEVPLARQAVSAFLRRDFENVDRLVDTAIAEGNDRAAAERIRALGQLARGDVIGSIHTLARPQHFERDDEHSRARGSLARALVLLNAGEIEDALRASLRTLAYARRRGHDDAEFAALRVMSACYRDLGRPEDAAMIEEMSLPRALEAP